MAYNTGNPINSADPRDLQDNAQNFDKAVNSDSDKQWTDRFGNQRKTWLSIETDLQEIIIAGGRIFPDEPTGRAAVDDGEYFYAESVDPNIAKVIWQRIDANSSRLVAAEPSAELVRDAGNSLFVNDPGEAHTEFADQFGFIIATLYASGLLSLDALRLAGDANPMTGDSGTGIRVVDPLGFVPVELAPDGGVLYDLQLAPTSGSLYAVVDRHGFIIAGFDGQQSFSLKSADNASHDAPTYTYLSSGRRTGLQHILLYGQSLSIGADGEPPISTSQPYQNVMFSSGVRIGDRSNQYDASALSPLIEQLNDTRFGETPASGAVNGMTRRGIENGGVESEYRFLVTSSGRGGRPVGELVPGHPNGDWERTVKAIRDAKALAESEGSSYSVPGMLWLQGNANAWWQYPDSVAEDYVERWLADMWAPMKNEIFNITGQSNVPYMFTYQAAHNPENSSTPYIGPQMAQWRASRTYEDVVLFAPSYPFPRNPDNVHATNEGYWLIGEYASRAMYETLFQRKKFRPLEPISAIWYSDSIVLKLHVPRGEVVIDNALFPTETNAGFKIRVTERDGEADTASTSEVSGAITGVAVTGSDEITISLDPGVTIPEGATLHYPQGNVRDTAGLWDKATSPLGNESALHNALVTFEHSPKYGF